MCLEVDPETGQPTGGLLGRMGACEPDETEFARIVDAQNGVISVDGQQRQLPPGMFAPEVTAAPK